MNNIEILNNLSDTIGNSLHARHLDHLKNVSLSFYIEIHTEKQAKQIAEILEEQGFDTDVDAFQQHSNSWRCWANINMVPNRQNLRWLEILLATKCREFNAELVSWETNPFESGQELGQLLAKFEMQYRQAV